MLQKALKFIAIAALIILFGATSSAQADLTKKEAEVQLKKLKSEISALQGGLESARSSLSDEQKALRTIDLDIQANTVELRKLDSTRQQHELELTGLKTEQQDYLQSLDDRRQLLAQQILAAYRLGRESRLKLVLNQDSPAELSRTLAYYEYFSRAQSSRIHELRQVLETLDQMQAKINIELSAVDEVQSKLKAVLEEMTGQRNQRQQIIDSLSSQIGTDESRLNELNNNRKDLETLLEKLSNVLADIPADLGARLGPKKLKGRMPMPVKGRVMHAYGQPRSAGLRWHGWLIGANSGSEVRAVAYGRVAYSDWLRGYGLLIIIDHGDGFLSLYANNESLLHEVGDWVEPDTVISTVGSSSLNDDGLYFEIRKDGKAMDPAVWLKR